jgi:hypothetical protein
MLKTLPSAEKTKMIIKIDIENMMKIILFHSAAYIWQYLLGFD